MPRPLAIEILDAIVSSYRSRRNDEDEGPLVDCEYEVSQFTHLELSGPFDVEVRTGVSPSVEATGSEAALDRLSVEHEGDRLSIGSDDSGGGDVHIVVGVKELRALRMS